MQSKVEALEAEVTELKQSLESATQVSNEPSDDAKAALEVEVAELKQSLNASEDANAQWNQYAASLGEEKAALESEVASLKEAAAAAS